MKKIRIVRYALPLGIALTAGLASVASAVNLGVSANNELAAGTSVTSTCQPTSGTPISVGYDVPALTSGNYTVSKVNLSAIAAACNGKNIKISVLDATNTKLADYTGTIGATTLSATLSVTAVVSNVATVAITIY